MLEHKRIYIAGHQGLVGSALLRILASAGCRCLITRTHAELDLCDAEATRRFFATERPEIVLLAAARVGGIGAMLASPAEFYETNVAIQRSVLSAAEAVGIERLIFLASAAIYPRDAENPIAEAALGSGPLEPSVEPYALAKIAGIEECRRLGPRFLAVAPCNLYGEQDHFEPGRAQVLASLLRKAHEARLAGQGHIEVWGTGNARRELLFADDLAEACLHLLCLPEEEFAGLTPLVNVGAGHDHSIRELAIAACRAAGFAGELRFDASKPEGALRKLLDSSRLNATGWHPRTTLEDGLARTYRAMKTRLTA
ncbi:GDP-L-fucose synthase family protein [Granulicella cerasi]|uniref:GDP-L-fucose synthase family protein n=1 Tax=Granulicella cerasi TaxID=741063 RepID=UPI0021E090AB|nr:GDP-L-fucose synthase [Granulicella cerasi]